MKYINVYISNSFLENYNNFDQCSEIVAEMAEDGMLIRKGGMASNAIPQGTGGSTSLKPVSRVRTFFPETWIWQGAKTRYTIVLLHVL